MVEATTAYFAFVTVVFGDGCRCDFSLPRHAAGTSAYFAYATVVSGCAIRGLHHRSSNLLRRGSICRSPTDPALPLWRGMAAYVLSQTLPSGAGRSWVRRLLSSAFFANVTVCLRTVAATVVA